MSAEPEPNLKYGHPDSAEEVAKRARILEDAKRRERDDWLQLYRIGQRCIEIADKLWGQRLADASAAQQTLSEQMRDRQSADPLGPVHHEIPVPLFTQRDRAQFIKEVAATLLISADRRNLSVHFPKEKPCAPEESQAPQGSGIEAASGTSEETVEPETTPVP